MKDAKKRFEEIETISTKFQMLMKEALQILN